MDCLSDAPCVVAFGKIAEYLLRIKSITNARMRASNRDFSRRTMTIRLARLAGIPGVAVWRTNKIEFG